MAPWVLTTLAVVFAGLLYFIYDGYLRLLRIIHRLAPHADRVPGQQEGGAPPAVAVLITVHNEAHQIVERVQNVLDQGYPRGLLDIVLASDGSTDELASVVAEHFGDDVRLVQADQQVGKSLIQNRAVESIGASIVLFSDADTRFASGFLEALVAPFSDPSVGAVQAHLLFVPADASTPVASQERYWRSELEIRQLESDLGILAVTSGCCVAVRRNLWRPLDPEFGEDCIIPLDVVSQSRKVVYAADAVAYEPADKEFDDVIGTRTRMTVRNWQATWSRSALLNPFVHPGYAFALWSHKVLRWLSPVWLIGLSVCTFALPFSSSWRLLALPAAGLLAFYLLALVGAVADTRSRRVPACAPIYAFMLANIGFLGGLMKAVRGHTVSLYR